MVVHPLESSGRRPRSVRGALASIAVHAAIILLAVHATAHAALPHAAPEAPPSVHYVPIRPAPPAAHPEPSVPKPEGEELFRPRVQFPVTVPTQIPVPTIGAAPPTVSTTEFGRGVAPQPSTGTGNGIERGSAPFAVGDVDRPVATLGNPPEPVYPEALRSSGIRGSVAAEFVVDTTGRVEPGSFRILASGNDLFSAAVRTAVLRTRFRPAEAGGRRVRQLVEQRFSFILQ